MQNQSPRRDARPWLLVDARGWFFFDETEDEHGPYGTKGEAAEALRLYREGEEKT